VELLRIEIDGQPAGPDEHDRYVQSYGHFTAMQVRNGRTRGLDLHLTRLDQANRELFGKPLDGELVRHQIRHALGNTADASVRVYATETSVIVTVREPAEMPPTAQRLRSLRYQRPIAHLKHRNGFGHDADRQKAIRDGYDDVLLTAADGTISEGGITNLGCWDGTTVLWPDAPKLPGITMQLLNRGLTARGVPTRQVGLKLTDLPGCAGVFVTNARGIAPVERVDDTALPRADRIVTLLDEVYAATPWQLI
jgi:branched-subunit amino acid aminotransferase/4-amino-4-deoxychorismate lyase